MRSNGRDRRDVWRGDDTRGARRVRAATLLALCGWLLGASATASAQLDMGIYGAGAGPVFAWGKDGGSVGWELSATFASPLLHFSVGGDYRTTRAGLEPVHYLAAEPGLLFFGASLGAAVSGASVSPYLGAWAGFGTYGSHRVSGGDEDRARLGGLVLTLAIGFRWFSSDIQFYLTPKAGYYEFPSPNT